MRDGLVGFAVALRASWRAARWWSLASIVLQVVGSVTAAASAWWLKMLVDAAIAGSLQSAVLAAVGIGVFQVVDVVGHTTGTRLAAAASARAGLELDQELMARCGCLETLEHFERAELLDRIDLAFAQRPLMGAAFATLANTISHGIGTVAKVVLLASVNPSLVFLPLLAMPTLWTGARASKLIQRAAEQTAERGRLLAHHWELLSTPAGGREARTFGWASLLLERDDDLYREVSSLQLHAAVRGHLLRSAGWLVFAAGYAAAIGIAIANTLRGRATVGDVVLVVSAARDLSWYVAEAVQTTGALAATLRALARFQWFRRYVDDHAGHHRRGCSPPQKLQSGIEVDRVSFRYPGTDRDVLSDCTLQLAAGSTVAIVGENGAGKTTLVKLLCGFYEPTSGQIRIDDTALDTIDRKRWWARTSAVFQDFARLEFTLQESVGVGDISHIDDETVVVDALRQAAALDLIQRHPSGLRTQLGRQFDGVELSGGQWQKVALSRAAMRGHPLLLILDEPTAALDAHAEHALFERYDGTARRTANASGAITLLISHRFSTVRMADVIVVLEHGRIIEHGSHEQLLERGGMYAELYELQARQYR